MDNIKYVTISDLTRYIKAKFDMDSHLQRVYIKGEISNFKNSKGHFYFTLKDEKSRIAAVIFNSAARKVDFEIVDGMQVLVSGRISVFETTGTYQIYVDSIEQDGLGNLYLEYEKLKKKLSEKGWFDDKYKKNLPKFPKRVGIITAPRGAAIRDILSTIKRRYPICETYLFPTLVQGQGAKESIVKQIETAQNYDLDVIICGRGGGSIEDLWAFNEECVAEAIFKSKIPIISAVGHEIDFTIADFVADKRAATPTGAAEIAVPNYVDIINLINQYKIRVNEGINNLIHKKYIKLDSIKQSYILKNPLSLYEIKMQKLDNLVELLNNFINNILEKAKTKYINVVSSNILLNPENLLIKKNHQFEVLLNKIELLNPLKILDKGYSVIKKDDKVIKDVKNIKINDKIKISLAKGSLEATVIGKEK